MGTLGWRSESSEGRAWDCYGGFRESGALWFDRGREGRGASVSRPGFGVLRSNGSLAV